MRLIPRFSCVSLEVSCDYGPLIEGTMNSSGRSRALLGRAEQHRDTAQQIKKLVAGRRTPTLWLSGEVVTGIVKVYRHRWLLANTSRLAVPPYFLTALSTSPSYAVEITQSKPDERQAQHGPHEYP